MKRRTRNWYGLRPGVKWARLWRGPLRLSFKERLQETLRSFRSISVYDPNDPVGSALSEQRRVGIIEELVSFKPEIVEGFPSVLELIACDLLRKNRHLLGVKAVISAGEMLSEDQREKIHRAFGGTVFNCYGGTEVSVAAHECLTQAASEHALHIQSDRVILEIIQDGALQDELGEIIVTDLSSRVMPIIKYAIGDVGRKAEFACSCGRELPLLAKVEGKINDLFTLPSGARITSHLWQNYFKKYVRIQNYQMLQKDRYNVQVKIVADEPFLRSADFEILKELLADALPGICIEWIRVAEIQRGPGGKFRHHISLVE